MQAASYAQNHHVTFGSPQVGWLIGLLIAATVLTAVGLLAVYMGVQYGDPSWGAHAYPPPLLH
jgi:hypothetical protein